MCPSLSITEVYIGGLALMEVLDIELAGEFLVMAASLMVIKARIVNARLSNSAIDEADDEGDGLTLAESQRVAWPSTSASARARHLRPESPTRTWFVVEGRGRGGATGLGAS